MRGHKSTLSRFIPLFVIALLLVAHAAYPDDAELRGKGHHGYARVCGDAPHGHHRCHSWRWVDEVTGAVQSFITPQGFGPTDLANAYKLPVSGGAGVTVAVVVAFDNPNVESDLAVYRQQFGLPACSTANGCFRKVNQNGQVSPLPPANTGWGGEMSLDVQMVSAACPSCNLLLVEGSSADLGSLGAAVDTAAAMHANVISNSYGGGEDPSDTSVSDVHYNHPGSLITASAGDSGFGVDYPAAAPTVLAVGGTSLARNSSTRGWSETVWNTMAGQATGSGCSQFEPKPSWQHDIGCARRTVVDVVAIADPATGVAVYDSYGSSGWSVYGGTSASAPMVAGIFARTGRAGVTPQYPYANTAHFFDVVSGSNGSCGGGYLCTAGGGYDGPSGIGSPNGAAMVAPSGAAAPALGGGVGLLAVLLGAVGLVGAERVRSSSLREA